MALLERASIDFPREYGEGLRGVGVELEEASQGRQTLETSEGSPSKAEAAIAVKRLEKTAYCSALIVPRDVHVRRSLLLLRLLLLLSLLLLLLCLHRFWLVCG